MALLGPQPNIDRMEQCFHDGLQELVKFRNVPPLAEGSLLLNAIRELGTQLNARITDLTTQFNTRFDQMDRRFEEMDRKFEEMDRKFDHLSERILANDFNNVARVQNSFLSRPTDRLSPLVNPKTNEPIDDFPAKGQDITSLSDEHLHSVLAALGLPSNGQRTAKERRLRQYIGLRISPLGA
ncbi:hypothetical protein AYL99_09789 [Fonsecaea erecta]|uniref:SAP domain-containing protein n=1 Tax=Fonsecaea erecta TaxID=1367422 RepID=A0A178Z7A2_9EURO|nr:hypothetical protein AYL99_09789 [Fonsecaea erecta]OAP55637.1 hypothetical protein AYL99_09789 [Fonsecaea erecta]